MYDFIGAILVLAPVQFYFIILFFRIQMSLCQCFGPGIIFLKIQSHWLNSTEGPPHSTQTSGHVTNLLEIMGHVILWKHQKSIQEWFIIEISYFVQMASHYCEIPKPGSREVLIARALDFFLFCNCHCTWILPQVQDEYSLKIL